MRKGILIILSIIIVGILNADIDKNQNKEKFEMVVFTEKYKTPNDLKTGLLKMHPIGSNVDQLIETLKSAEMENNYPITKIKTIINGKEKISENYLITGKLVFGLKKISITIKFDKDKNIEKIDVNFNETKRSF